MAQLALRLDGAARRRTTAVAGAGGTYIVRGTARARSTRGRATLDWPASSRARSSRSTATTRPASISLLLALALNRQRRRAALARRRGAPRGVPRRSPRPSTGSRRSTPSRRVEATGRHGRASALRGASRARTARAWCCSRRDRPASTRRRSTTCRRCSRSLRRRGTAIARSCSCCSITSAASTRSSTRSRTAARSSSPTADRRRRCAGDREHRVELLPTSPTFLNLLLLSGGAPAARPVVAAADHLRHRADAGEHAASASAQAFPDVRLLQTYGLTELGILRSQSRELRLAVGAGRRRGLRDQGRRRPALDPRRVGDARVSQRAQPVRRRRLLRHRRSRRGRRRVDPVPRPQERDHQRRRQKVYPAEVESVLLELETSRMRRSRGEPQPDHRSARVGHDSTGRAGTG